MDDDVGVDDVITKFLLNTTRLRPRLTKYKVDAALACGFTASDNPRNDEVRSVPLSSGSVAEFYIEPMFQPCFGDVDIMYHYNADLAVPRGHSPPTQLPDEFHVDHVHVLEIIDSQFPGYVYLEARYILEKCSDGDTFDAFVYDGGQVIVPNNLFRLDVNKNVSVEEVHGPAQQVSGVGPIKNDYVPCVRCLLWPTQAADWPTRHRTYEWPDSATVGRVVSDGCDLVGVAHRECRQDEWMGTHQWRLSFSRAEIVLINSWMPLQQIVYHLLRVFLKTERLTESTDNSGSGTLSNYHIKTLMLWACELKPRSWWTDNFSFTAICADLVHHLSQWLNQGYCPHYFITCCNLFDQSDRANQILAAERLCEINQMKMIKWFVESYLQRCCERCPSNVSRLFDDVTTSEKLQRAVSAAVNWRKSNVLYESWDAFQGAECIIAAAMSAGSMTAPARSAWMKELTKLDEKLVLYFNLVSCLHIACKIPSHGSPLKWRNLLAVLCDALGWDKNLLQQKNASELVEVLQQSAVEQLTVFRQLEARHFGSVDTIVTTDFEAMYAYKRGDYQRCLQLSTQNVMCTLLCTARLEPVPLIPEFLQLLDDDIVSLTALTLIGNPDCRHLPAPCYCISQLTLSLYLMTQCQLKLRHWIASLDQTLDCIEIAQRRHPLYCTLDQLTLKLAERKILIHISEC